MNANLIVALLGFGGILLSAFALVLFVGGPKTPKADTDADIEWLLDGDTPSSHDHSSHTGHDGGYP
jgi:hypothetical protein